jgi:hypothetical protein
MIEIHAERSVPASAHEVWELLRTFEGIERFVDVFARTEVDGTGVGARRTCTMLDGRAWVEELASLDDEDRTLTYTTVAAPLPISAFEAGMRVTPESDRHCLVTWWATFDAPDDQADEVQDELQGLYEMGLEGVRRLFAER